MAITKESKVLLASAASVAGASTKLAPARTGLSIDCRAYYGGSLFYKITNGASAPTTQCVVTFQVSNDDTNWYDFYNIAGDITANSINSGALLLDRGIQYIRAISYGNQTNAVTVEATLSAILAV